jgi:hypothetical protein
MELEFNIDKLFIFDNNLIDNDIINESNSNNIFNKILNKEIPLTNDIIFLLIIISLPTEFFVNTTYKEMYYNIYNLIYYKNYFINNIYWNFYNSEFYKNNCYNIIKNCNLEWLYKLCIFDNFNNLEKNFNDKYNSLNIENKIKTLFNYEMEFLNNNIIYDNKYLQLYIKNSKEKHDKTFNIYIETCTKYCNGFYKNL